MKLPIYDIQLNPLDNEQMMSCISFVESPAVEVDFLAFNENKQPMKFSVSDTDKHCITGVAIRAGVPIYRYTPTDGEYYVRFTKEVIEDIVLNYSKNNLWNSVSLQHSGENITDAVMIEYFIKSPTKYPDGFQDVEDGSLMVTYKILNDELWNTIKNTDTINGFSIEIFAELKTTGEYVEEDVDEFAEIMNELGLFEKKNFKRVTRDDVSRAIDKNRQVNIKIGERTLNNQQIFQLTEDSNGKRGIVVYNPNNKDWTIYSLKDITLLEVTENELENWDFNSKWKNIISDDTLGIIDTAVGHSKGNTFRDAILNKQIVMVEYYDEENEDGKGYRTCFISSLGYTTGGDGMPKNQCLRAYEYNGSSHSGLDGGVDNWRFFLTRRIKSFKIVDYVEPLKVAPIGYNEERQADSGKWGTMSEVELVAKFD